MYLLSITYIIIEYSSTLYAGMTRKKWPPIQRNGKHMHQNSYCRSFKNAWQRLPNRFMIKNGKNIDAKLSIAASQHGSKIGFSASFFSRPSAVTLEATTIIFTRNSSILSGAVH